MEVGFQKSLQLFVANGYYVFENDICVDLPDVIGGKPNCVNSPLLGFFAMTRCPPVLVLSGAAVVEVANSPLPGFFARARCPPVLAPSEVTAVEVYN